MILWAADTCRAQKLTCRAVYAKAPAHTEYLEWSDSNTTFDRSDHPAHIPQPGNFALVVNPFIDGFRLLQVLMDGCSRINIIFPDTSEKMGISKSHLSPSSTGFHGFVLGRKAQPLGRVELEVIFGDEENFRSETICFEVSLFITGYNAILGRPAYVKFMVLPSYAYLQLKMPGPNGAITIHGSTEKALVKVANVELSEAALDSAELEKFKRSVNPDTTTLPRKPWPNPAFQLAKETKKFQLHPEDPSKMVVIGSDLSPKQEAVLLQFLKDNWDIFA